MNRTRNIALSLSLLALAAGCQAGSKSTAAASGEAKNKAQAARPAPAAKKKSASAKKPAASGKVKRIVFIDKAKACECTKKRIDASWKALAGVVGKPPVPAVERIHMDTAPFKAAPYKAKRPVMVPPAIYFLGEEDKLLEVLQGEVTAAQVKKALR